MQLIQKKDIVKVQNKSIYIEILRIFAIFWVVFDHTGDWGYTLFTKYTENSLKYWIYLGFTIFCKVAVPIFFAISGALMLGKKEEPLKKIWKKKILKFFLILFVFSAIYYLVSCINKSKSIDLSYFFKTFYTSRVKVHLWYLYLYIAYLMVLPFLRSLVENLETKYFYYMLGIVLVFDSIIPTIDFLLWKGKSGIYENIVPAWIFSKIVMYPIIGYFLHNKIEIKKSKIIIPVLWIINIFCIVATVFLVNYQSNLLGKNSESKYQTFTWINCITIFLTAKVIFEKITLPQSIKKIIISFGASTFGIYLIHLLILNQIDIYVNFINYEYNLLLM